MDTEMNIHRKQAGFTFGNLLLWLIIGGFALTIGFKLGPSYMENATIQSVLDSLKEESATIGKQSASEIRAAIGRRLAINGVKRFASASEFEVNRDDANTVVSIQYEVREKFFKNLDVVVSFTNSVELPAN